MACAIAKLSYPCPSKSGLYTHTIEWLYNNVLLLLMHRYTYDIGQHVCFFNVWRVFFPLPFTWECVSFLKSFGCGGNGLYLFDMVSWAVSILLGKWMPYIFSSCRSVKFVKPFIHAKIVVYESKIQANILSIMDPTSYLFLETRVHNLYPYIIILLYFKIQKVNNVKLMNMKLIHFNWIHEYFSSVLHDIWRYC